MTDHSADLVIFNGNVLTMDGDRRATAVAIEGNRIAAVGTDADMMALAGPNCRTVDAGGATVMPGFVESHMHIFPGSISLRHLQLAGVRREDALRQRLLDHAQANPDEGLLIAQGTSYKVLGDRAPDRHVLDAIIADRPLLLQSDDLHNAWANTVALERAGILHGGDAGPHAEIVVGEDGLATGFLKEFGAQEAVFALRTSGGREPLGLDGIEPDTVSAGERQSDRQALENGLAHCASLGITTILNMDGNRYQADLLSEMDAEGALPCRIEVPYTHSPKKSLADLSEAVAMRNDYCSDKLWSGRVKLFMDGVIDARTAYRLGDYPGYPGERGHPFFPPDQFNEIATEADRLGLQISVHAIGEGAVRVVLDGYAAARATNGVRDSRHRIEHIETIRPEDIARLADFDVIASMQPVHPPGSAGLPLEPTLSLIGEDLWPTAYAWREIQEAGCTVCFSTDWPVSPLSPLYNIQNAVTRRPWTDALPDQRLSLPDTLKAVTINGAKSAFREHRFGCLRPGHFADIVILSADIERCPPDGIAELEVRMTICDGVVTHEAR